MKTNHKLNSLSEDVRDAIEFATTGKALPVHVTRYVGKIKVEETFNGEITWSLHDQMQKLPDLNLNKFTSWADIIRSAMKFLGQGDEGFAQMIGIPVSTIRAWKQGGRDPRGPGRRLLEVSLRYPEIMWDVVRESTALYEKSRV